MQPEEKKTFLARIVTFFGLLGVLVTSIVQIMGGLETVSTKSCDLMGRIFPWCQKIQPPDNGLEGKGKIEPVDNRNIENKKPGISIMEAEFSDVAVRASPTQPPQTYYDASIGLTVKNSTEKAIRIAIVPAWPVIRFAGIQFSLGSVPPTGLATYPYANAAHCERDSVKNTLTEIGPGVSVTSSLLLTNFLGTAKLPESGYADFSAAVMVYDIESQKCHIEGLSGKNMKISVF